MYEFYPAGVHANSRETFLGRELGRHFSQGQHDGETDLRECVWKISVSSPNCFRVVSRRFASDLSPRVKSIDTHDTHDQITDEQRPRSASCERTSRSDDETGSDSTSNSNHTNLPVIVHVNLIVSGMNPLCILER